MQLKVLGTLALAEGKASRPKPLLLLCYLALEGSKSRAELARLFFYNSKHPADALSTTLRRLPRDLIHEQDSCLSTSIKTDFGSFKNAIQTRDWHKALGLYGGIFLEPLNLQLGWELEDWLIAKRKETAELLRNARLGLCEDYLEQDDAASALYQLHLCIKECDYVEPTQKEVSLLERLLERSHSPQLDAFREMYGHLLETTSPGQKLIGREHDLDSLHYLLKQPTIRLVNLLGGAGVGKTSLGLELMRRMKEEQPDSYTLLLENLSSEAGFLNALANTLGLVLKEQNALGQIVNFIAEKPMLLFFDNFEQLSEHAPILSRLLAGCPKLNLLLSSRQKLYLKEEYIFNLEGLSIPEAQSLEQFENDTDSAVALFRETVRKHAPMHVFVQADLHPILHICKLTQGYPLAIELAAPWLRLVSALHIADALSSSLDLLVNQSNQASIRHSSIELAFDYSWRLLNARQQAALLACAVFQGGFSLDDIKEVAGTELKTLSQLLDKSLLQFQTPNRYTLHPLLSQYVRAKLMQDQNHFGLLKKQHAYYYLSSLNKKGMAVITGQKVQENLDWIEQEFFNLALAFRTATQISLSVNLEHALLSLSHYAELRARYQDFIQIIGVFLENKQACLDHDPAGLVAALGNLAWHQFRAGDPLKSRRLALETLDLAKNHNSYVGRWTANAGLYGSSMLLGQPEEAINWIHAATTAVKQTIQSTQNADVKHHAEIMLGISHAAMSWMLLLSGNYEAAYPLLDEAKAIYIKHQSPYLCYYYSRSGQIAIADDKLPKALDLLELGLRLARSYQFYTEIHFLLLELARAKLRLAKYEEVLEHCSEGLQLTETLGEPVLKIGLLAVKGRVLIALKQFESAKDALQA
ncbi:MAG: hypothetical protein KC422_25485, partial [Trueperaceae bacterium]|nr:hypothetical protein [Trueperaceae bacterium]